MIHMEIVRVNVKSMQMRAIEAAILQGAAGHALAEIRIIYHMTFEMVDCLNDVFGYSQFETLLFCYFLPLTDLNWAYMSYQRQAPMDRISKANHWFLCKHLKKRLWSLFRSLYMVYMLGCGNLLFVRVFMHVHRCDG